MLSLQNQTYVKSGNTWSNNVLLQNYRHGGYDLVYSYDYTSTASDQKTGWVGSWAPIVETFQATYSGLKTIGFSNTYTRCARCPPTTGDRSVSCRPGRATSPARPWASRSCSLTRTAVSPCTETAASEMSRAMDTNGPSDPEFTSPVSPPEHASGEAVRDMREWFAEITRQQSPDDDARRGFLLAKLELVKNDSRMAGPEKREAIRQLEALLDSPEAPGQASLSCASLFPYSMRSPTCTASVTSLRAIRPP